MADRRIEAQAVISAADRTGGIFGQVARKIGLIERASKRASAVTAATSRHMTATARAQAAAATAQAKGASRVAAVGGSLKGVAGVAGAYGATRLVSTSLKSFADLESKVVSLGITAEATQSQVRSALDQFRVIAPQYGVPAGMISDAAEKYVAAGVSFKDSVAATAPTVAAAKASGGEISDLADAGIASMLNLGIRTRELGVAFDIMAKGGKLGNFELRNMAKELPGVASRARSLGLVGTAGLTKIVAMLETTRKTAKNGEEAANNLVNLFDKITSADTAGRFKKMGVNLEQELKKGLASGQDFVTTTLQLVEKLTKGDPFKIAKLFNDRQAREALNALIKFRGEYEGMVTTINKTAVGTNMTDLNKRLDTSRARMDKLGAAWDVLKGRLGEKVVAPIVMPGVDKANEFFKKYEDYQKRQRAADAREAGKPLDQKLAEARAAAGREADPDVMRKLTAERDRIKKRHDSRFFTKMTPTGWSEAIQIGDLNMRIRKMKEMRDKVDALEARVARRKATPTMSVMPQPRGKGFGKASDDEVGAGTNPAFGFNGAYPPVMSGAQAFSPTGLRSALSGLTAEVKKPVDVTGKVELKGRGDVNVRVTVDGPGRITGLSASSEGNIRAKASTTMSGPASQ